MSKTSAFYIRNILPGTTESPEVIMKFMRDCRKAGQAMAISSDRLDAIYDVLQAAFAEWKNMKVDGLVLIIVAERKDPKRFDALLLPQGITPVYATY